MAAVIDGNIGADNRVQAALQGSLVLRPAERRERIAEWGRLVTW